MNRLIFLEGALLLIDGVLPLLELAHDPGNTCSLP
jgi:hypothetical protein